MPRMTQILLSREFKYIGECSLCKGVAFFFEEKILGLENLSRGEIRKLRQRVQEGVDLNFLLDEFEGLYEDEVEYHECEKCKFSDSSPTRCG